MVAWSGSLAKWLKVRVTDRLGLGLGPGNTILLFFFSGLAKCGEQLCFSSLNIRWRKPFQNRVNLVYLSQTTMSVRLRCYTQNAVYQCLSFCTTLLQGHMKHFWKTFFQSAVVCFRNYWVPVCFFFEYPVAFQPLPLCSIPRYELCVSLQWVALALFKS